MWNAIPHSIQWGVGSGSMEYREKRTENVSETFLKLVQEGACERIRIVVGINKMVPTPKVSPWNNRLSSWSRRVSLGMRHGMNFRMCPGMRLGMRCGLSLGFFAKFF